MSVDYRATLGYGVLLSEVPDPDGVGEWEVIEQALAQYPLVSYESGGGGWSNADSQYVLYIRSTTQELKEIDGVITLKKPTITFEAKVQLEMAYKAISGEFSPEPQWLIAGGFY